MHSFAVKLCVRQVVKESVHEQFDYIGKLKKFKTQFRVQSSSFSLWVAKEQPKG